MALTREMIDFAAQQLDPNIKIQLIDQPLWEKFYYGINEMIVTRSGRKMFPVLKINVEGLDTSSMYTFVLQFEQITSQRWKYLNAEWSSGGRPESAHQKNFFCHGDSPNYGLHWMTNPVVFNKVKLSNKEIAAHQVRLNSLHKYEPVLKIFRGVQNNFQLVYHQPIQVAQFIAVTAYQNEKITNLKIKYNPFAKAFQEAKDRISKSRNDNNDSPFDHNREMQLQHNYNYILNSGGNPNFTQQQAMNLQAFVHPAINRLGISGRHPHRVIPYASPNPVAARTPPINNINQVPNFGYSNTQQNDNFTTGSCQYEKKSSQTQIAGYQGPFQGYPPQEQWNDSISHMHGFLHSVFGNEKGFGNLSGHTDYRMQSSTQNESKKNTAATASSASPGFHYGHFQQHENYNQRPYSNFSAQEQWKEPVSHVHGFIHPAYSNDFTMSHFAASPNPSHYPSVHPYNNESHGIFSLPADDHRDGASTPSDVKREFHEDNKPSSTGSSPHDTSSNESPNNSRFAENDDYFIL